MSILILWVSLSVCKWYNSDLLLVDIIRIGTRGNRANLEFPQAEH